MAVTANFLQDPIEVVPGSPTSVTLRLHNDSIRRRVVKIESVGDLAEVVTLDAATTTMETNQIVDIGVAINVAATFEAGPRTLSVAISSAAPGFDAPVPSIDESVGTDASHDATHGTHDGKAIETSSDETITAEPDVEPTARPDETVTASATVDVVDVTAFAVDLRPARSKGATGGSHRVRVVNSGNVAITVEVEPGEHEAAIRIEAPKPTVTVMPGTTKESEIRAVPNDTYWSGPTITHGFTLRTAASDGTTGELVGSFDQRPRLPNWVGPAAAGALAALAIAAVVWFAALVPWVEDTADDAAASAIEQDRAALQLRIEELEAAAADAQELPLGSPTDLRLSVAPTGGNSDSASETIIFGQTLSVTDVVFQNPTGAVGTVTLLRDDDILLQSELANFRDFDLHLVAPFVFEGPSAVVLEVECRTPGTGSSDCPVSATLVGFVDEER